MPSFRAPVSLAFLARGRGFLFSYFPHKRRKSAESVI